MGSERRSAPRYQFIAEAEVYELHSGTIVKAKTGDLSLGGCFLDTLNPSQQDTEVRVTIAREGSTFTALGHVVFVFPNLGMGVVFTAIEPNNSLILQRWIEELKKCSRSAADESRSGRIAKP